MADASGPLGLRALLPGMKRVPDGPVACAWAAEEEGAEEAEGEATTEANPAAAADEEEEAVAGDKRELATADELGTGMVVLGFLEAGFDAKAAFAALAPSSSDMSPSLSSAAMRSQRA